jgi:penicillin-binding protein 2
MHNVTTSPEGTGYKYWRDIPYTLAAKTGTAQLYARKHTENEADHEDQSKLPEHVRDHSLLIAFAPIDNPQIALAVVVENSNVASVVARKIMDYYFSGIQPTSITTTNNAEETTYDAH